MFCVCCPFESKEQVRMARKPAQILVLTFQIQFCFERDLIFTQWCKWTFFCIFPFRVQENDDCLNSVAKLCSLLWCRTTSNYLNIPFHFPLKVQGKQRWQNQALDSSHLILAIWKHCSTCKQWSRSWDVSAHLMNVSWIMYLKHHWLSVLRLLTQGVQMSTF